MSCSIIEGGFYMAGTVLFFGSFAIFMKIPPIQRLDLDPVVFQAWKSFWAFSTCFLILFFRDFHYSPYGIASALFWIPAGTLSVIAVRSVGMSIGQGIWSGMIVLVNCFWGILIFEEPLGNTFITFLGICLLAFGVSGIGFSKSFSEYISKHFELNYSKTSKIIQQQQQTTKQSTTINGEELMVLSQSTEDKSNQPTVTKQKYPRWIGYSSAVIAGLWGGSIYAPMKVASQQGVKTGGADFLVSFGIGVAIVQPFLIIVYGIIRKFIFKRRFFPDFAFKSLWWAGSLAGIFWAIGNFFSLLTTNCLGQAIGFSGCQSSLVVAGLWGVFYFKEIRGLQMVFFFISSFITLLGVCLMMYGKSQ